jgi:hypothetical protein
LQWLVGTETGLSKTMTAMFAACKEIAYKIRTASCDKMVGDGLPLYSSTVECTCIYLPLPACAVHQTQACFNEFGDEQLAIDVLANNVIFENLSESAWASIRKSCPIA